jgi:hypothetical protein
LCPSDAATASPPFGRLDAHLGAFHLLEEVFHAPGGGVELRHVLGIYSSRRAAEHAAQHYCAEHEEDKQHAEHFQLVTREFSIDKPASDDQPQHGIPLT